MNKKLVITIALALILAASTLVLADLNPCNDLGKCWEAAQDYCEQIYGSYASWAYIEYGPKPTCEMECADGHSGSMVCNSSLPACE